MTRVSFRLFLFTLAFAPLAFGTVEHWSLLTVQVFTAVSLVLCLLGMKRVGEAFYRVPGVLPFGLLLGFILFQLIPLPPGLVKIISPSNWEAYRPVFTLSEDTFWVPISVNQKATLQEFLRISCYGLFYILTVQVLRTGAKINRTLKFIALLASVTAFIAILQQFSSNGMIYWFRPAPGGHPGGPWININQYAAFIESVCPVVLGMFLYYRPLTDADSTWRERTVSLFSSPQSNLHLFLGFAFVLVVFSVFVTLCRGGIITIMASMVLFAMLSGVKRRGFGRMTFWVVLCLSLLAVSWFGWQPIIDEFGHVFDSSGNIRDARIQLWSDTLVMIKDFPVFGGGFGTYNDVYPSYKTIENNLIFDHAHNDYLELLSDGGIVGFGLAAWFVVAVLLHGWRKVMMRQDRLAVLVGMGALTSICALLMHSIVDFNLHNGAVGLYFFFICGLLVAVVNHRYTRYKEESLLPQMGRNTGSIALAFTCGQLVLVCVVQVSILVAAHAYMKIKDIYVTRHLATELVQEIDERLQASMMFDPLEGRYPFYSGNVSLMKRQNDEAFEYYMKAARKQPMNGVYLQRLGIMLPEEMEETTAAMMEEGYRRALNKNRLVYSWAEWLLITEKRDQAIDLLKSRFTIDPAQFVGMIPMLQIYDFTREEMEMVLPQNPDLWIRYGDYLEKSGEIDRSLHFRKKALEIIDDEEQIKVGWVLQLVQFYRRQKKADLAIETIRLGIKKVPGYAPFHIWLGDYYIKNGITYRAQEEYERAVMLAPRNESYRRKLRKLELDIEFEK